MKNLSTNGIKTVGKYLDKELRWCEKYKMPCKVIEVKKKKIKTLFLSIKCFFFFNTMLYFNPSKEI